MLLGVMVEDHAMASREGRQDVWRMRVDLGPQVLRVPAWPEAIRVRTFSPGDAEPLHALLVHGYRNGGGRVAELAAWLPQMTTDAEFDPELWFLAVSSTTLVGAALCWTSAFVKDLVVHESWRRRGLGEALLRHVFTVFAKRGAEAVELKVQATNAGAIGLYQRLGMRVVERLDSG
jgi:ribosomal protein S18 acetylase RimI-like enzyme